MDGRINERHRRGIAERERERGGDNMYVNTRMRLCKTFIVA